MTTRRRSKKPARSIPRRRPPVTEIAPFIVVEGRVRPGRPLIRGTRVPVETVLGGLAGGMSVGEVALEYRMRPKEVRAAIAYAARLVGDGRVVATRR
ncbi:MAG TPA: DUF433 domain-containing protein [Planctomycetota bacterium]|nr:DUF433 domain-containing protein [Planctomycetota bacterium]